MNNDIPSAKDILVSYDKNKALQNYTEQLREFIKVKILQRTETLAWGNTIVINPPNVTSRDSELTAWLLWENTYPIIIRELTEKGYTVELKKDLTGIYISI